MKLAAEKNLNKFAFPVFSIKGRPIEKYPVSVKFSTYELICYQGSFDAKSFMILDILGTLVMHGAYKKKNSLIDFKNRIPTSKGNQVKELSEFCISKSILDNVVKNVHTPYPPPEFDNDYRYPDHYKNFTAELEHFSIEGALSGEDKKYNRAKKVFEITITDSELKMHVSFLKRYSSKELSEMIRRVANFRITMHYPVRFFNYTTKDYENYVYENHGYPCSFFTLKENGNDKISVNGKILSRSYRISFNTMLGFFFIQNCLSCYTDLIPFRFYDMSDYAQLFYRILILPYYGDIKNPIEMDEIRNRLLFKTKDRSMVRKVIMRILNELTDNGFIGDPREEKVNGKYVYHYTKNTWKQILGHEKEPNESDLICEGTDLISKEADLVNFENQDISLENTEKSIYLI